jgi:hypothetical protein
VLGDAQVLKNLIILQMPKKDCQENGGTVINHYPTIEVMDKTPNLH